MAPDCAPLIRATCFIAYDACGRRTPSRHHKRLAKAPSTDEVSALFACFRGRHKFAVQHHSGATRLQATRLVPLFLDTGFRRYDGERGMHRLIFRGETCLSLTRVRLADPSTSLVPGIHDWNWAGN